MDLEIVDGPWAAALSEYLGYDVQLARASRGVVYGASVSRVGARVPDSRLRATFTVHTDAPHREDAWIDLDPDTGTRGTDAMRVLANFVANATREARVHVGDAVELQR